MDNFEEIQKLKKLAEQGIISDAEFQKKKNDLLGFDKTSPNDENPKKRKSNNLSANNKILISLIAVVVIFVGGFFGVSKVSSTLKRNAYCKAASESISSVMNKYGLPNYEVISAGYGGVNVLCPDFEKLSDSKKFDLIYETIYLGSVSVNGQTIKLNCDVYVNSRDYYYYVSPLNKNYKCGGIYKYDGNRYCVFESNKI